MVPVLKQENAIYYVNHADIIRFIQANSTMEWNAICDFVGNNNIGAGDNGPAFWQKVDVIKYSAEYNEEQIFWIGAFFEAHPWIEQMMVVFDD